ncbi:MAG: hypothetical protein N2039_13695, partial [Gemmataceae bacterium]|nr:hypothetical protein [Gemmataceae bacterium]
PNEGGTARAVVQQVRTRLSQNLAVSLASRLPVVMPPRDTTLPVVAAASVTQPPTTSSTLLGEFLGELS